MSLVDELSTRIGFNEFNCGCENRKQIMGSENWQHDLFVILAFIVAAIVVTVVMK